MPDNCSECVRLEQELRETLHRLMLISTSLMDSFRDNDQPTFARLDKELELIVGEKERGVGALRQHAKDHESLATHI
jgi:hypothetical protein